MPISRTSLLTDLKRWVTRFEDDLRQQCKDVPALDARLKEQYQQAKAAKRTAFSYPVWRDGELTQSAVGWVLSCVFVRFLEDNGLLERTYLSGIGENRDLADETRAAWFRENRAASDNDYLAHAIGEVGKLPGMADLMDARHNALWNAPISPDAAKAFIEFWRRIDPGTGKMAHEFTDPDWDTRFLGDLYQDLSESARKRFALLQTPDFVEEFILDRTLDPAIDKFGLDVVRMIDPTCGSGHFLLGAFRRLLALWEKQRPDLSDRERAVRALAAVHGVDINPFAVAIARFRLLLEAWKSCGVKRLRDAPDFHVNLAAGDSLLHGARFDAEGKPYVIQREELFGGGEHAFRDEMAHHFQVEDAKELHRILGQQYHAVVGNPPYITVKDAALNELYRQRYDSCAGKYALSVPFMERFFDLTLAGSADGQQPAGFQGQITSNSFMKREFGKKLIEEFIPRWDLTHIIDTSGAYIPGHGTPTVILFGRNVKPKTGTIRTIMGIKGEPGAPEDPAQGLVWTAILNQVDCSESQSEFVSAADTEREKFRKHPWSLSGGGAADLKELIEKCATTRLEKAADQVGVSGASGEDELYLLPDESTRLRLSIESTRHLVVADGIRDWNVSDAVPSIWPYNEKFEVLPINDVPKMGRLFWIARSLIVHRKPFGIPLLDRGMKFYEWQELYTSKLKTSLSILLAEVATHNHFALDRGGSVFKNTVTVVKLPSGQSEDDHLRLIGTLNSSTSCFWLKQVSHNKGSTVDNKGARQRTAEFEDFYQCNSTKLKQFPVVEMADLTLVTAIQNAADAMAANAPDKVLAAWAGGDGSLAEALDAARSLCDLHRRRMIYWQEELDWQVYELYRLIDPEDQLALHGREAMDLLSDRGLSLGERTFEIFMARQMARGTFETTWFERHKEAGSRPITEPPQDWPGTYMAVYVRRHHAIQENKSLNLIERPEFKRRWNTEPWASRQQSALESWLLTRLESYFHDADRMVDAPDDAARERLLVDIRPIRARFAGGTEPRLVSVRQLAAAAQTDARWMEAATVHAGRADFDVVKLVETLVLAESVPALPADRYKDTGLRHRIEWEKTWELQRAEDAVEAETRDQNPETREEDLKKLIRKAQQERVGDIPVPPKYAGKDFKKPTYWKLRGKLDVPKERWVLYPGAEGGIDSSPVIAWAGWDHAQQAQALTGFYQQATDNLGWEPPKLARLLAALKDLLPWLHQWHNALDPTFGDRPCDSFQSFYDTERHTLRLTDEEIEAVRMGGGA
ncbi:MAG: BREX-2 system adenine-specific DNA-methyltransferase PglX [Verrucomicrobia bacterium]|nr:MAG: BREX-2 system adenine-specific DNA-methyltransferase PglX [Verrucomicrobiota bacterium]